MKLITTVEKPSLKDAMDCNPLFSADYEFSRKYGGWAIQSFLASLPAAWGNCVIDTRLHMLKPGWYPAIPGWHLDDIPRDLDNDQPNMVNPRYSAEHRVCIFDYGTGSLTEFLNLKDRYKFPTHGAVGETLWETTDKYINSIRSSSKFVEDATVYEFGDKDYHRVSPAEGSGWRIFIRASIKTERPKLNIIRRQTQVYLSDLEKGW